MNNNLYEYKTKFIKLSNFNFCLIKNKNNNFHKYEKVNISIKNINKIYI